MDRGVSVAELHDWRPAPGTGAGFAAAGRELRADRRGDAEHVAADGLQDGLGQAAGRAKKGMGGLAAARVHFLEGLLRQHDFAD